jgi:hypothetical protein
MAILEGEKWTGEKWTDLLFGLPEQGADIFFVKT